MDSKKESRNMIIQVPTLLKLQDNKRIIIRMTGIIIVLLFIMGGILFQVNPLFRKYILCPFCVTTDTSVDSSIYIISHTASYMSASKTFFYTLDKQKGNLIHKKYLNNLGEIYYQKIIDSISYVLACRRYISYSCTDDILLAIRLSDGATLWSDVLEPPSGSVIATPTMLYMLNGSDVIAINPKDGRLIWRYKLQSSVQITLDNNTLIVQKTGDNIIALRANDGKELWRHGFNDTNGYIVAPVADNGHVFVGYVPNQKASEVFEFDETTGSLLWQKKMHTEETIDSLHIENHCLLIETTDHKLYVLQGSDKSVLWSYTFPVSYALPQPNYRWIYTDDIVYGLSTEIDPQTFATNRVLRAWQINDGQKIFQTNIDIVGNFEMIYIQNDLIFTSTNDGYGYKTYNDVEARQAQTGTLLWHTHLGQLPRYGGYTFNLSVVDTTGLQVDGSSDTTYYLPDNDKPNQSILYITMYYPSTHSHMIYALDGQNGHILWQVNPNTLDTNQRLHIVTEFPLSTASSGPEGITAGPDGNLWFTEHDGNQVGRITPNGKITEFPLPTANSGPKGITAGSDGNLWFTESGYRGNQIGRITPDGKITEFPISTYSERITVGPDGNLWFTETGADQIGRITPDGKITEFPIRTSNNEADRFPVGIAAGSDGNLWFTESSSRSNQIGRITPDGKITEFPISISYGNLEEITAGPDGNLWFTEHNSNQVGRITPDWKITEFAIPTSSSSPVGITTGLDGNLWFTEHDSNQIGRIRPRK